LLPLLDLLLGDGNIGQALTAHEIAFRLIERRLMTRHIGLGLIERILKASLIDAEQLLAFAHLFVVVNKDVADQGRKLVVAGCHTPTVLNLVEESLDQVASPVKIGTET